MKVWEFEEEVMRIEEVLIRVPGANRCRGGRLRV